MFESPLEKQNNDCDFLMRLQQTPAGETATIWQGRVDSSWPKWPPRSCRVSVRWLILATVANVRPPLSSASLPRCRSISSSSLSVPTPPSRLQVSECNWPSRQAPGLHNLFAVCKNMHNWLKQNPKNVCVITCSVRRWSRLASYIMNTPILLFPELPPLPSSWPQKYPGAKQWCARLTYIILGNC